MNRELVTASIIGALGALCLVFGILGYLNPESSLIPMLANSSMALGAISIGVILMVIEAKLILAFIRNRRSGTDNHPGP